MKSTGTIQAGTGLWSSPNQSATNSSGFTGLPGGWVDSFGTFNPVGGYGYWWSTTQAFSIADAWVRYVYYNNGSVIRTDGTKENGFSVRLIKD